MKRTRATLPIIFLVAVLAACDPDPGMPTPAPASNNTTYTALSKIGNDLWVVSGPTNPTATDIVQPSGNNALRIDPNWKISKIDYSYQWWGLGEPGHNNGTITFDGTTYKNSDNAEISASDVQSLIQSLDNFYPAQQLMQGKNHTDDYPSWTIEILGTDNQSLTLLAASNGNPGEGPWNILYNGLLYAQYNGAVAKPLGKLFGGRLGDGPDRFASDHTTRFATVGLPRQLRAGFSGLLPISNDFFYEADTSKSEIHGHIIGSSVIGTMDIGEITTLNRMSLTTPSGDISCETKQLPEGDPWTATIAWDFKCPITNAKAGASYSYPLSVSLATSKGETITASGELWGAWPSTGQSAQYTLLLPPTDIMLALNTNPDARDLLTDHILGNTDYSAILQADNPMLGKSGGQAALFGATAVSGNMIRYTVDVDFTIEDGKVTYWDLNRDTLNTMLEQITSSPLTKRVVEADPNVVINMWYASGTPETVRGSWMDYGTDHIAATANACAPLPGGHFPYDGKPLMGFAFNSNAQFSEQIGIPFVLIDGKPIVADLTIHPGDADPIQKLLIPDALNTGSSKPFESIKQEGSMLRFSTPINTTPEERAVYNRLIDALPDKPGVSNNNMALYNVTLAVNKEGKLQLTSCSN